MKKVFLLLSIVLVTILLVTACGKSQPKEVIEPTGNVVEIDVIAKQWSFEPNLITVKAGDTVKLNIRSVDVNHGFSLLDFGVSNVLVPGQTVVAEFVADKRGTFSFFCSVSCGRGHRSMRGQLIVE